MLVTTSIHCNFYAPIYSRYYHSGEGQNREVVHDVLPNKHRSICFVVIPLSSLQDKIGGEQDVMSRDSKNLTYLLTILRLDIIYLFMQVKDLLLLLIGWQLRSCICVLFMRFGYCRNIFYVLMLVFSKTFVYVILD